MKKFLVTIISLLSIFAVVSCVKDNYKTITEEEFVEKANKLDTNPYKYAKGECVIVSKDETIEFTGLYRFDDGLWVATKQSILTDNEKEMKKMINNTAVEVANGLSVTKANYNDPELEFGIWNNNSLYMKLKGTADINYYNVAHFLTFAEIDISWDEYGLITTYNEVDEIYRKNSDSTTTFQAEVKTSFKFYYGDTKFSKK